MHFENTCSSKSGKCCFTKDKKNSSCIQMAKKVGFASTLVSSGPTFGLMYKMDEKGVVLNSAFSVSAAFVFGSHLAFTMALDQDYIPAMMVGKLIAGVLAILVAHYVYESRKRKMVVCL